jgi:hypothetical protein
MSTGGFVETVYEEYQKGTVFYVTFLTCKHLIQCEMVIIKDNVPS